MISTISKKIIPFLLVSFISLNITACTNKTTPPPSDTGNKTVEKTNDLSSRADKIAKELITIKGIKSANVVISEERALVGVNLDEKAEGTLTDNLKNEVDKKVKSVDPKIKTVAVSADPDVIQRITNVGKGINEGKPLSEFGNEIEEIFRRIMPK